MRRRLLFALLLGCLAFAALALAGGAGAIDYGVTEDEGKSDPAFVYPTIADLGMKRNIVSLTWDAENPTALPPDAAQIDRLVAQAPAHGVEIVFALYQKKAAGFVTAGPAGLAQLSTWLQTAARRWPGVKRWIGFNEPNQPRFLQPQFNADCTNASAALYASVQATMYDALKSVDGSIQVIGVALSPRGNDLCSAPSNVSTSPVRFLSFLGKAFRAERGLAACRPLMDGISFHPYPNVNTDPPSKGYQWPNIGVPNLDRLKQAFWDAFNGTCQKTFEDGLQADLDEFGYQTDSQRPGYEGSENVPTVDEATQARYHAEVAQRAACDPSVSSLNFFHLVDEANRDRFQSGLLWVDRSRKAAYDAVKQAIAAGCNGSRVQWRHTQKVIDGRAIFRDLRDKPGAQKYWAFSAYAGEDASYEAGLFAVAGPNAVDQAAITRELSGRNAARKVLSASGKVKAYFTPLVKFPGRKLQAGYYVYGIRLKADVNERRTSTFVSKAFKVGKPAKAAGKPKSKGKGKKK